MYLPLLLIFVFSVVFPVYKLFLIGAILTAKNQRALHKAIQWSTHLRQTAKFQFLDIFVAIFMRAYLNQDVLHTELKEGFFVYLLFCILSLITAEVLTVLVDPSHLYEAAPAAAEQSKLDRFMLMLSSGGMIVGLLWALLSPVLIVKVALKGSLTVSQSSLSLLGVLIELLFKSSDKDATTGAEDLVAFDAITGGLVLLVFAICVPLLFLAIKAFAISCSSRKIFGMMIHDWALGDVMALGLFTTLISLNSFENLSAEAPEGIMSGFYFLIMYGLSCFDLSTSTINRSSTSGSSHEQISSSSEAPLLSPSSLSSGKAFISKLSGSFLLMKSVGWGVFFLVWFMHAGVNPVDIDKINTALRANIGIINSALQGSLPRTVGNCSDPGALNLQPCIGNAPLYYNKDRYEVEARWLSGVNTAEIEAIVLSAPVGGKLALSISGKMNDIPMSLAIGECFTPDVYVTGTCDKLWDNTDACCGRNKHFNVVVVAECFEDFPFVRNISMSKVGLDPIVISVSVIGFKINLEDVTEKVRGSLEEVIRPYLSDKAFIQWGDKDPPLTLADLVNKIIKLNSGDRFTCPDPIT